MITEIETKYLDHILWVDQEGLTQDPQFAGQIFYQRHSLMECVYLIFIDRSGKLYKKGFVREYKIKDSQDRFLNDETLNQLKVFRLIRDALNDE